MTDKLKKWEPSGRQSRRVLSSLGLASSPGQAPSNSGDRQAASTHTAAARIMAALNYASESRPVAIPELESMSPVPTAPVSSSAPAPVSGPLHSSSALAATAVTTPDAGGATASSASASAIEAALEPMWMSPRPLSLPLVCPTSLSPGSDASVASAAVPTASAALASTPAVPSHSLGRARSRSSSSSTITLGLGPDGGVPLSASSLSVPASLTASASSASSATSASRSLPTTTRTFTIIPPPPPPTAPIPIPRPNRPPFAPPSPSSPYRRPRSLSFYDAHTSSDAALPGNRHLLQYAGIGSSSYAAAARDAAIRCAHLAARDVRASSPPRPRPPPRMMAPSVAEAFAMVGAGAGGEMGGRARASSSFVSGGASAYPFRREDLDAAYRRASEGAGFTVSMDGDAAHRYGFGAASGSAAAVSGVRGGGSGSDSRIRGILKRRYAPGPTTPEKRVTFLEDEKDDEDEELDEAWLSEIVRSVLRMTLEEEEKKEGGDDSDGDSDDDVSGSAGEEDLPGAVFPSDD